MASSSGTSSVSIDLQNSGSEEDLKQKMDQRKRKRMISNRESARRSRMKKQKHLDDLMTQVAQLKEENNGIISTISVITQNFINIESENSVLRAQVAELSNGLESLNEIMGFLNAGNCGFSTEGGVCDFTEAADEYMNNSWNYLYANLPIMASVNMLQY